MRKWLTHFKELYCRFQDDEIQALGAQITYYLILAFFPFLIVLLTVLSYTRLTTTNILYSLSRILPTDTFEIINEFALHTISSRSKTLLSFGTIATIWAATNGITALIRGINKAYDEEERRSFLKIQGISILFMLALILAVLFSLVMLIFGELIGRYVFDFFGFSSLFIEFWDKIRFIIPIGLLLIVFAFLYKYAPSIKIPVKEVWPGALFSTAGWLLTSLGFSYYVNNFGNYANTYGSIGGVIVLLVWLYWSSVIFLVGGELNATLAFDKQGRKKPRCKHY